MRTRAWAVAGLVGVIFGCGKVTAEEFQAEVEQARACAPGATCVLGGWSMCSCDVPLNASRLSHIDALRERLDCGGMVVDCAQSMVNLRCEEGQCTGDRPLGVPF